MKERPIQHQSAQNWYGWCTMGNTFSPVWDALTFEAQASWEADYKAAMIIEDAWQERIARLPLGTHNATQFNAFKDGFASGLRAAQKRASEPAALTAGRDALALPAGLERCEFDDECDFCNAPEQGVFTRLIHNVEDTTEAEFYICGGCLWNIIPPRKTFSHPQASEPVGINGLTEAETSASMSVLGLSNPTEPAPSTAGEPRPVYGKPGTRDIDVAEAMKRWDAAHAQPAQGERSEAAIRLHDAWLYFTGAEPSLSILGQAIDEAAALLQSTPDVCDARINPSELADLIEGMSVSVDVSTGEHDAGNRLFGTVSEVMECLGDKHGLTLLVQDPEPNFKTDARPVGELTDEQRTDLVWLLTCAAENLRSADKDERRIEAAFRMASQMDSFRAILAAAPTQSERVPLPNHTEQANAAHAAAANHTNEIVKLVNAARNGITGGEQ